MHNKMKWFREGKFGMFIHWGLYSKLAGEWKGKSTQVSEQIMLREKIPLDEYTLLAQEFNPIQFDPEEWVELAKDAGVRYLVITAKHHDGFAMYGSKYDDYNIVEGTPFARDPMKELAEACKKHGIKMCFYYSLGRDWHHPDVPTKDGWRSNTWDYPNEEEKDLSKYFREKVMFQVEELLTNYGPVGLIWFDTHELITEEQSKELRKLINSIQPNCVINSRIGNEQHDYKEMSDRQIPDGVSEEYFETCATINDSWGYHKYDNNWKSTHELLTLLINIVSKGGNFLLNVGPTAEGIIPEPSVVRLREIGQWLKRNGEAVYGTNPNPFKGNFEWGTVTTKDDKLYLHIFNKADQISIKGFDKDICDIYYLTDVTEKLEYCMDCQNKLTVYLHDRSFDDEIRVVVVKIKV